MPLKHFQFKYDREKYHEALFSRVVRVIFSYLEGFPFLFFALLVISIKTSHIFSGVRVVCLPQYRPPATSFNVNFCSGCPILEFYNPIENGKFARCMLDLWKPIVPHKFISHGFARGSFHVTVNAEGLFLICPLNLQKLLQNYQTFKNIENI